MNTELRAFHNDPKIKEKYLARVIAHREADQLVKGRYWEGGKGCAVGCTVHSSSHAAYEKDLGIPQVLARLEDRIFENIPNDLALTWPERFLSAIGVGADLSKVWPKFAIFLLTDASQCASRHRQCRIVSRCFERQLNDEMVDWKRVKVAAAAYAAAADAAADAALSAADAARDLDFVSLAEEALSFS